MCLDITYTQSDITFSTHLTVAMVSYMQDIQWYDVNHAPLDRRRRGCVLAKPHLLVTGHLWEELACEELACEVCLRTGVRLRSQLV